MDELFDFNAWSPVMFGRPKERGRSPISKIRSRNSPMMQRALSPALIKASGTPPILSRHPMALQPAAKYPMPLPAATASTAPVTVEVAPAYYGQPNSVQPSDVLTQGGRNLPVVSKPMFFGNIYNRWEKGPE